MEKRTIRGREEVEEALVQSATQLFSERGLSAISVRDIAHRAGVNHGLVHRHFGSKMGLVQAVSSRLLQDIRAASRESPEGSGLFPDLFQASREQRDLMRIRMYALLEGHSIRDIQGEFHVADHMKNAFRRAEAEDKLAPGLTPELATASLLAASMGWMMFEPFLLEAAGLESSESDSLAHEFDGLLKRMIESVLLTGERAGEPEGVQNNPGSTTTTHEVNNET